jgi:transcription elongation factor GreB
MSRAFVKESNGDEDGLPERPRSPHINYVTPHGLSLLHAQLDELLARKSALAGLEDLASRQQAKVIERDLRYFQERIESAVLIDPEMQLQDRVHFGATVEVLDEDGTVLRFTIVGEDEADVAHGKISWVSPLARALLNARVSDVVTWRRPAGDRQLEILSIQKGVSLE